MTNIGKVTDGGADFGTGDGTHFIKVDGGSEIGKHICWGVQITLTRN